jgi:hypothetical protein
MCSRSVTKQSKAIVHSKLLNIKAKSPDLTLSNRVVVILFPHLFSDTKDGGGGGGGGSGATSLNEVTWRDNFKAKMAGTSWRDNFLVNFLVNLDSTFISMTIPLPEKKRKEKKE